MPAPTLAKVQDTAASTSLPTLQTELLQHWCRAWRGMEGTFAHRPGLIALIRLAEKARASDELAKLDTAPLTAAIISAEATAKQPANEKNYSTAIRALAVPEAKTEVLHLFDLGKW